MRTKEEVDKERILAQAAAETCFDCGYMGMKIVQDESFYVEPALTNFAVQSTSTKTQYE